MSWLDAFDGYLKAPYWLAMGGLAMGGLAMGGQMIDASIVPVPRQRNGRDENAAIKGGVRDAAADQGQRNARKL